MGERTDEIRNYASPGPERYSPSLQTGTTNEFGENFTPDYTITGGDSSTEDSTEAETEAIRDDIEQTRAEMARTVDEIQARLTPQNIVEQVKETAKETASEAIDNVKQTVRDATVGKVENMVNSVSDSARETSSGLMGLIKDNPIPATLAGLGLGWLYMKRQNNSGNNKSQGQAGFAVPTSYLPTYPYNYGTPTPPPAPVAYGPTPTYNSSAGSSGGSGGVVDKIMQNPLPVAVAGLSIGYILMKGQGQNSSNTGYSAYSQQGSQQGLGQVKDKVGDVVGQAGQKVGDIASGTAGTVGDIASGTAGAVGNVAGSAVGAVGDAASTAAGAVGDIAGGAVGVVGTVAGGAVGAVGNVASGAGDVAGNVVGGVQEGAQKATTQLERMLQENPLVVGGAALVLGAVIGMMLPSTEKENQILGKAHDTLMDKAGEAVHQTLDKVSSVTEEVTNTVKEEAKNQGLTQ